MDNLLCAARPVFRDRNLEDAFSRDGYVVIDFLAQDEIDELRTVWESLHDQVKQEPFSVTIMSPNIGYRLAVHERISAIFKQRQEALLSGYRFCYGNFVSKQPGARSLVPVHQDPSFIDETRFASVNFWVPLTDVDLENGCLHVAPGTHVLNRFPRGTNTFTSFPYPQLLPAIIERFWKPLPMRAGQAIVMNQMLFHGSPPNSSDRLRVAVSGIGLPCGSPMWYVHQDYGRPSAPLSVYEVPDDHYQRNFYGIAPQDAKLIGEFPYRREPVTLERLAAAVSLAK